MFSVVVIPITWLLPFIQIRIIVYDEFTNYRRFIMHKKTVVTMSASLTADTINQGLSYGGAGGGYRWRSA